MKRRSRPLKVVVLNSGGMDSVVLLNWVKENNPDAEIHCIHFDYGQNNREQEYAKAFDSSVKAGATFIPISLPKLYWTSSDFYGEKFIDAPSQELELRNLIFLSYAMSYCLSVGATEINVAFLKENQYYKDTSPRFVSIVNAMASSFSVRVKAPLQSMGFYKENLGYFLKKYGIGPDDFFSCNTPVDGKPCGVCPDCKCIEELFEGY